MASCPEAASGSTLGMKCGTSRLGPRCWSTSCCSIIPRKPPIAVPKRMPTRIESYPASSSAASSTPSRAAASDNSTLRSSLRTFFGDATVVGSKSFTSAAIRTGNSLASNERMKSTPLRPATAASQVDRASFPTGVTAPRPVTTIRRIRKAYGCAGTQCPLPTHGGAPRRGAARGRRLAVRAQVGRVSRRARERLERALSLESQRPAAAPVLPRALAARRVASAPLGPRRRDRARAERPAGLRRAPAPPPPRREPHPQALGRDPHALRPLRRPALERRSRLEAAAGGAPRASRGPRPLRLPSDDRREAGEGLARAAGDDRARRCDRQATRAA